MSAWFSSTVSLSNTRLRCLKFISAYFNLLVRISYNLVAMNITKFKTFSVNLKKILEARSGFKPVIIVKEGRGRTTTVNSRPACYQVPGPLELRSKTLSQIQHKTARSGGVYL